MASEVKPITIAVADDDEGMRLVLGKIVERAEGYELVGLAKDGEEMLRLYDERRPQVAVLDVEMPGLDGIQCARAIQDRNPLTVLIFATAHEQYMGDAFELYAFDYLLKPFKVERALNTLRLVRERLMTPGADTRPLEPPAVAQAEQPSRIMLKHRDGINFVDLGEIMLVQREDRMTVVYAENDKRFVTSMSMAELEEKLPQSLFFRCHKSYIVNLNRIDSIAPYGRWTYIIKLRGTRQDALITHERFEALEAMYA